MRTLELTPTKKQWQFINSTTRYTAYGGARGGGKSYAVRMKALMLVSQYPGIKVLIIRSTFRELDNNHIQPLIAMLNGSGAKYNRQDKRFTLSNGSTISFGYYATDSDGTLYQGAEYDVIFIDEATNLKEEWLQKIYACCRGVNDFPKQIYLTCNPGGVSHAYIKRLYVDRVYKGTENPEDYSFIKALVTDNKALMETDPEYVRLLMNLPPKLRDAWLNGSWDIFSGQYFEEFRIVPDVRAAIEAAFDEDEETLLKQRRFVHVIEPFRIPSSWNLYRSFDWGYHHPFSAGYWACDTDGVIYRIAELYGVQHAGGEAIPNEGVKWVPDKVFSEMQKMEREHPLLAGRTIRGVADPAIWDVETGISYAETAAKYGIFFEKG